MSTVFENPNYKAHLALVETTEEWDALKAKITAYLEEHAGTSAIDVYAVRAIDPAFTDVSIWNQITADMQLFGVETHE